METQILRCEICGGELKYAADGKSAQCLNCGNEFWFKEEKSGAVALALNRAAEKRRRNDFDSAIDEYRLVIHENPQDADAHWGLAISTYGIEYVEDYRTGKLVPTCRRAVPRESILDNADFKAALECAAPEQRAKYEEQAKEIDRLQKEIIKKIDRPPAKRDNKKDRRRRRLRRFHFLQVHRRRQTHGGQIYRPPHIRRTGKARHKDLLFGRNAQNARL